MKLLLKETGFNTFDTVFLFLAAFTNKVTKNITNPVPTTVHTTYCMEAPGSGTHFLFVSFPLLHKLETFSLASNETFGALDEMILFTLKFHTLQHIAENSKTFGDVVYLVASPSEHFNYVMRSYLKMISLRKDSTLEEAVQVTNASQNFYQWDTSQSIRERTARMKREGF